MKRAKKLFVNMVVMTATALLIRTVGVSFSAYLFNRIGSVGVGIYSLIMSVYTLAITIATSGIRFTATRLVSEELGKKNGGGVKKAVRSCLLYALAFSITAAVILFFGAEFIGNNWLDDARTIPSLKLLAAGLPFISVTAVISGYLTAVRKASRGSLIQILDQLVMVGVTIWALTLLMPSGLEYACVAVVLGSVLSEVVTCCLLSITYLIEKRHYKKSETPPDHIWSRLLKISLPIAFSAYARSGLMTLQNILIPRGLKKFGASQDAAMSAYGTVHGMVLPLVLYPSALLVALAELLIPELTECQVNHNTTQINYIIQRVLKLSFLFSVCVMGVLFFFSEDLSTIFAENDDVAFYLKLFAPLVLVMYMDTIVDGMLKGLGEQLKSMKYNVIDAGTSVLLVYFLIPIFGIKGYLFTVMVSEILNFTLSLGRLIKVTRLHVDLLNTVLKPILCMAATVLVLGILLNPNGVTAMLFTPFYAVHIAVMCLIYGLFLFLFSCLKKEDGNCKCKLNTSV